MVRKIAAWLFALGLLVWLCAPVIQAQEKPVKLYVGVAGLSGALAHAFIPKDSGLYEKYGLDVELIFFSRGNPGDSIDIGGRRADGRDCRSRDHQRAGSRLGYDYNCGLHEYSAL